jgi:hypothetical protein
MTKAEEVGYAIYEYGRGGVRVADTITPFESDARSVANTIAQQGGTLFDVPCRYAVHMRHGRAIGPRLYVTPVT